MRARFRWVAVAWIAVLCAACGSSSTTAQPAAPAAGGVICSGFSLSKAGTLTVSTYDGEGLPDQGLIRHQQNLHRLLSIQCPKVAPLLAEGGSAGITARSGGRERPAPGAGNDISRRFRGGWGGPGDPDSLVGLLIPLVGCEEHGLRSVGYHLLIHPGAPVAEVSRPIHRARGRFRYNSSGIRSENPPGAPFSAN